MDKVQNQFLVTITSIFDHRGSAKTLLKNYLVKLLKANLIDFETLKEIKLFMNNKEVLIIFSRN